MAKLNIVIKNDTEDRFRKAVSKFLGMKKGNISKAVEEAIELWVEDRESRSTGKVKIGWS
jgi:hypothetical protein